MDVKLQSAATKLNEYKSKLDPHILTKADELADNIIDCRTASAEMIWEKLWDKPLHTNQDGDRALERTAWFRENVPSDVWKMDNLSGDYFVEQIPKDERPMLPDINGTLRRQSGGLPESFRNPGDMIKRLQAEGGIAYQLSNAIFSAGRYLKRMTTENEAHPFSYLHIMTLEDAVDRLDKELGYGWGHITIMHFLTDLGLACKPDRHLVRAVDAIGLPSCTSNNATLPEALRINKLVCELRPYVYGGSATRRDLRHLDKILMEISSSGILGETERDRMLADKALARKAKRQLGKPVKPSSRKKTRSAPPLLSRHSRSAQCSAASWQSTGGRPTPPAPAH